MFTSTGNLVSQRDLAAPLIPSAKRGDAYDEESPPDKWFKSTTFSDSDGTPSEELSKEARVYRKVLSSGLFGKWGSISFAIMITMYFGVLVLAVLEYILPKKRDTFQIAVLVAYGFWQAANFVSIWSYFGGFAWFRRMCLAWGGLYVVLLWYVGQVATIAFLSVAYQPYTAHVSFGKGLTLGSFLPLFLAVTVFVERKYLKRSFRQLHWYYQGIISVEEEEAGEKQHPTIARIGSVTLQKVARNACKAIGITDEAAQTIEQILDGQQIRQDKDDALDDWTLTINKITKAVSFAPHSTCRSKSAITSAQCRDLICQMIIYLRQYMDTGRIEADETSLKRSAPILLGDTIRLMFKFCMQTPLVFFLGILPQSAYTAINTAAVPLLTAWFINGVQTGDSAMATKGFILTMVFTACIPFFLSLAAYGESKITSSVIDVCRRKMHRSMVNGGTKFNEKFRTGDLTDAFGNQLNQLEIYCQCYFLRFIPSLIGIISAVVTTGITFPLAVIIFFSLMPIIFSIDYFELRAAKAALRCVIGDTTFMGKIGSVIKCLPAIRVCDAGNWITKDMDSVFRNTKQCHFDRFFDSAFMQYYMVGMSMVYTLVVSIPLGIQLLRGEILIGDYMQIATQAAAMMTPIIQLADLMNSSSLFSGSLMAVNELMGDSLDEESPSDQSSGDKVELPPLKNAVKMSGIKFRYGPKLPDVLQDVDANFDKGSYNVVMGESGSGKSTVLNLLMRFRLPYQGSIKWDGTDIFSTSLKSFREQVAVMFQETMIYQGTVRDNILFGMPDEPGAVEKAARDAEIHEVIQGLPDGYDTRIGGDELIALSGGQQQRICMARALYRKPTMLLLDEATSALDGKTEKSIIDTVVKLRDDNGLTVVSVTHRPATAIKANKIIMLRVGGTVAEEGSYDELVSREGGPFKKLVDINKDED